MALTIGKNISKLISRAGYESLGQLYRDSAVSVATLSRIVNDVQKPTPATLKKLAPCLRVPYKELLSIAGYLDDHESSHNPEPLHPDIRKIARAREKMTEDEREKFLKVAETLFPDAFKDK